MDVKRNLGKVRLKGNSTNKLFTRKIYMRREVSRNLKKYVASMKNWKHTEPGFRSMNWTIVCCFLNVCYSGAYHCICSSEEPQPL